MGCAAAPDARTAHGANRVCPCRRPPARLQTCWHILDPKGLIIPQREFKQKVRLVEPNVASRQRAPCSQRHQHSAGGIAAASAGSCPLTLPPQNDLWHPAGQQCTARRRLLGEPCAPDASQAAGPLFSPPALVRLHPCCRPATLQAPSAIDARPSLSDPRAPQVPEKTPCIGLGLRTVFDPDYNMRLGPVWIADDLPEVGLHALALDPPQKLIHHLGHHGATTSFACGCAPNF